MTDSKLDKDRYDKGVEMFKKVYGDVVPPRENAENDAFMTTMLENTFGTIWARDVLSIRDRRLVIIGITAAAGIGDVFELQCKAAVQNGELTPEQVMELLLILAQYNGYPRTADLLYRMRKAFPEAVAKP